MNARTSKLIRRWALASNQSYRALKREWNRQSRTERSQLRGNFKAFLK